MKQDTDMFKIRETLRDILSHAREDEISNRIRHQLEEINAPDQQSRVPVPVAEDLCDQESHQQLEPLRTDVSAEVDTVATHPVVTPISADTMTEDVQRIPEWEVGTYRMAADASYLFPLCQKCGRLNWIASTIRSLPGIAVPGASERDGIVLIVCRRCSGCKSTEKSCETSGKKKAPVAWNSFDAGRTATKIDVHPRLWSGTEIQAATSMISRTVLVLGDGQGGTGWMDVVEFGGELTDDEVMGVVDVAGFRKGLRGWQLCKGFTGGLF